MSGNICRCSVYPNSARQQGENILITVADTGVGIRADMLGTVFDMFTQINRTLDRAQGELGIGLSLVKTPVEMHSGNVHAVSRSIELGSESTVTLPTVSAPVPDNTASVSPTIGIPLAPIAPLSTDRILVVDDNVDAAETMAMLLGMSGLDARAAFGGQEALDVVLWFRPDIVFLDIGLTGIDRYEVTRRLLADQSTARRN